MGNLYVTGGQQQNARSMSEAGPYWYKYGKALILEVDTVSGTAAPRAAYVSPPAVCPREDPAILFKSGTLEGDQLYVCTQTEVLVYSVPDMELRTYLSLPSFNDVHHVRPSKEGHLLIANSGLDMVLEVTHQGEIVRAWNTLGEDPWDRFSRAIDYRVVSSLKPHASHPNHTFYLGDELWVTRFEQRDAICLDDSTKRIEIGIERIHDGHPHDGKVYFTAVSGQIVVANAETLERERVLDLNGAGPADAVLGWCRGLLVEDDSIWVGFSKIRLTKFRQNLSWIRSGFRRLLPTRIARYNLVTGTLEEEIDLQQFGLDAVFSIFPARHAYDTLRQDDAIVAVAT